MKLHWKDTDGKLQTGSDGDFDPDLVKFSNAACVIKINPPTPWASEPSNPIDDIRAFAEHVRRVSAAGPQPMSPRERAHYNHLGALLSAAAARLPPLEPEE